MFRQQLKCFVFNFSLSTRAMSSHVTPARPIVAFISGPLAPEEGYFQKYYHSKIISALQSGHGFVTGSAPGIDTQALDFLLSHIPPGPARSGRIAVYSFKHQRLGTKRTAQWYRDQGIKLVTIGYNHTDRDEACTKASHYDILHYRTVDECKALYGAKFRSRISGTEKNEIRRAEGVGLKWPLEGPPSQMPHSAAQSVSLADMVAPPLPSAELSPAQKQRRNLEKKIRDGEALIKRLDKGEKLEMNQLVKVERLEQWRRQLESLPGTKCV